MSDDDGAAQDDRIALNDEEVAVLSDSESFDPNDRHLVVRGTRYTPVEVVGRGYKGVVWKVRDPFGAILAAKIALGEDYKGKTFHEELSLRARLPNPVFTRCLAADHWMTAALPDRRFVVTVEEWVEGITLDEFLVDPTELTIETLRHFARGICAALRALQANELAHDDLHARNIMLRRLVPGEGMAYGQYEQNVWMVVVVDTGSLKPIREIKKDRDDVRWIAEHLISIHNQLRRRPNLTQTQLRYLRGVLDVVDQMVDPDPTRALREAEQVLDQLEAAYRAALVPPSRTPILRSPFDFISAERIADDNMLIRLFTKAPWMNQVAGPDPILLTGPRGCGKSMLFRWLAVRTHLSEGGLPPEPAGSLTGVYISCTTEMQNRFLTIRTEEAAQHHAADIVHYFNLLLARELLITLDHISRHPQLGLEYGIGDREQATVLEFIVSRIQPTDRSIAGTAPLRIAIAAIEREMFQSHRRLIRGEVPIDTTSSAFLGDLTDSLAANVPGLNDRPVAFLLDDFSTHRVPEHVQRVLGPIVWERRPSHVFKVSSEKNGVVFSYAGGATVDASRDREEIDCGKEYIDLSSRNDENIKAVRAFARDLLATRLELAGWAGTPEQLIGASPPYREWIQQMATPGAPTPQYFGMRTISELCSGDVATLLLIYRRILVNCDAKRTELISASRQDEAICGVSSELLANLVPQRPLGKDMFKIACSFAHFAGRAVKDARPIKEGEDYLPRECPRIEVDQGAETAVGLDQDLLELYNELVRRSVFIELDNSRSRRDQVATLRWHFRRIYMPAYRGPLRKNDALKFEPSQFEWFLTKPEEALRTALANRSDRGSHPDQGQLFGRGEI